MDTGADFGSMGEIKTRALSKVNARWDKQRPAFMPKAQQKHGRDRSNPENIRREHTCDPECSLNLKYLTLDTVRTIFLTNYIFLNKYQGCIMVITQTPFRI